MFDFVPNIVWIYYSTSATYQRLLLNSFPFYDYSQTYFAIPILTSVTEYKGGYGFGYNAPASSSGRVLNNGYMFNWFNTNSEISQFNTTGETYYWLATSFNIVL